MTRKLMGSPSSLARGAVAALGLRPPVVEVPSQGFVLHDVTVVNPGMDRRTRQSVTVKGSTIADISSFESVRSEIEGDSRYAGTYALPGLIDMHVHFPALPSRWIPTTFDAAEGVALLYLAHGVTTSGMSETSTPSGEGRRRWKTGYSPCPRMFCCGQILDGEAIEDRGACAGGTNPAEARAAVNQRADRGAGYIKVYDWLNPESLAAAREAAAKRGLRIVGQHALLGEFRRCRRRGCSTPEWPSIQEHAPGLQFPRARKTSRCITGPGQTSTRSVSRRSSAYRSSRRSFTRRPSSSRIGSLG